MRDERETMKNTENNKEDRIGSTDLLCDSVICGDNVTVMREWPDECIDLVVTSPPYDNLRTYGGHEWDFEGIAEQLTRCLKPGGVIVWVVADATVNGSETLTSMRQAIHFKDVCGLNVHDTMIYQKNSFMPMAHNRYEQCWEYMIVISKGSPKSWNPIMRPSVTSNTMRFRGGSKQAETSYSERRRNERTRVKDVKQSPNLFTYDVGKNEKSLHNAPFPLGLASDHIQSWGNPGDIVLDPFAGSGTTLKAAKELNRRYIGIEINPEYVEICNNRTAQEVLPLFTA